MTPAQLQIVLALMAMVMQYGVPAVTAALGQLNKETVTIEDIEALKGLVKPPEEY